MKKIVSTLACLLILCLLVGTNPQIVGTRRVLAAKNDLPSVVLPLESSAPASDMPTGLSPAQIRSVYHLPSTGGYGTIAIIDAYDAPTILNDTNVFCTQYGLPNLTSSNFEKHMMGTVNTNGGWATEISLDVQWAHAIAPSAKILLVEANDTSGLWEGLMDAIDYARSRTDVIAISMSWSTPEFLGENNYDFHLQPSGNSSCVFFAASGDNCENVSYPACSPNVVGVGGTVLNFSGSSLASEAVWYDGIVNNQPQGTGGGISQYETEPAYQTSYGVPGANGHRCVPDVSFDAGSGVSVYDSTPGPFGQNWLSLEGTSLGSPSWAAIYSVGLTATNDRFYTEAKSVNYTSCFRDIVNGANGNYNATSSYDFCTGLGSPLTTMFHYPPSNPALSGPQTVFQNVWYIYTTNAVTDPDGGQIRYHLNVTGPGTPYQNTTIWVNSGTPMSWNLLWEPTDNSGTYLIQVCVEDSYGMLSNMTSLSVTMVKPLCASKTTMDGCFYVPNPAYVNATFLRVEMLFNDTNLAGDQTGNATTPYPAIANYPDGKVDMKDTGFVASLFMSYEGASNWNYMADITGFNGVPDRIVNMRDVSLVARNFGKNGSYIHDLSGVAVTFNTGPAISPDANGFVAIPSGATSFNVTQNSTPIGAMIIFCGP